MAAGLAAAVALPAKAFMELESSTKESQNTLMTKDGLVPGFKEISAIAIKLGNKLPGTTTDFNNMAVAMHSAGMSADVITKGGLEAAAYLGLVTKNIGGGYEMAADSMARLGVAFKIADEDMVGFADTLAKTVNLGAHFDDINYALARVSGSLSGMHLQGAGVAKAILPVIAMLNQIGIKGESAGTGLNELFRVVAPKHPKSIQGIIENLFKLKKQNPEKIIGVFTEIFGKEHGMKLLPLAEEGGYAKMLKRFEEQASLAQKVANTLGGLASILDAASGTFEGAMAVFGEAYAPEMKKTADALNEISAKAGVWLKENGPIIKMAIETAGAFVGPKLGFLAAAYGLGVLTKMMKTNLFFTLAQGLIVAAPYIYEHWGEITEYIKTSWQGVLTFMDSKFQSLIDGLLLGVNLIRGLFNFEDIKITLPKMSNATVPSALNSLATGSTGMTLPGASSPAQQQRDNDARKRMAQTGSNTVRGGIDVNFNNTPTGTRVIPYQAKGPISVTPNVGYRSFATGMQ